MSDINDDNNVVKKTIDPDGTLYYEGNAIKPRKTLPTEERKIGYKSRNNGIRLTTNGSHSYILGGFKRVYPNRSRMVSIYRNDIETPNGLSIQNVEDDKSVSFNKKINPDIINQFSDNNKKQYFDPWTTNDTIGEKITDKEMLRYQLYVSNGGDLEPRNVDNTQLLGKMSFEFYQDDYDNEKGDSDNTGRDDDGYDDATSKRKRSHKFLFHDLGVGMGESLVINPLFQFNELDDPRTHTMYRRRGRVYATYYDSKMPIIYIQPGRIKYHMNSFNLFFGSLGAAAQESYIRNGGPDSVKGWISNIFATAGDVINMAGAMFHGIFGGGKLIEFVQSYNLYKQYANYLIQSVATMLGLVNRGKYVGRRTLMLDAILVGDSLGGGANFRSNQFLAFRVNNEVSVSESFSNSIGSNPLADFLNDKSSEAATPGANLATGLGGIDGNVIGAATEALKNFAKKAGTSIAGNFSEAALIMSGKSKANLPGVWESSTFSRSISFDFKFHSPYGDTLSIFENTLIPLLLLISLTAPKQVGKYATSTPFYIRVHMKNKFNIEFGMIESLDISRGEGINDITPSGLSKTISCNLTIRDHTPILSLPLASRGPIKAALEMAFPSTGMTEYLSSLGGLTMVEMRSIFGSRLPRAWDMFGLSINGRLNKTNITSSIMNIPIVDNVLSVFWPNGLDEVAGGDAAQIIARDNERERITREEEILRNEAGQQSIIEKIKSMHAPQFVRQVGNQGRSTNQIKDDANKEYDKIQEELDNIDESAIQKPYPVKDIEKLLDDAERTVSNNNDNNNT